MDVSGKRATSRSARAVAVVTLGRAGWAALNASENRKGDALAVARLAGIQAAKRTAEWIPLCHPLVFDAVDVTPERLESRRAVVLTADVRGTSKTGYEMEALVAATAAALALYDMCKAADKGIVIGPVALLEKTGGKSGAWRRAVSVSAGPSVRGRGRRSGGGRPMANGGSSSSRRRG
ncbi:MAG: cyclic pyranopterin monophosphate synthase MoaC [Thermoanaerobaculia bacterium]